MPTYSITAINVGTFDLGEKDKILTLFSAERGLVRAVAKGARKPGSKIGGRADVLNVNRLFLSTARSIDIITQAESLETFPKLRTDLTRLSFALYYAELTQHFGQGLAEESAFYFEYLIKALTELNSATPLPEWLCLRFELGLLDLLGYRPELTYCVLCRQVLSDFKLGAFHQEWGGILCSECLRLKHGQMSESGASGYPEENPAYGVKAAIHITPLVWKHLVLALSSDSDPNLRLTQSSTKSLEAAQRLIQGYIEHRAGRRMKSLDLLSGLATGN